jgi:Thioesterase-like superfamily
VSSEADPAAARGFFFRRDGASFVPEAISRGPWGETLHGRLLGGLTAREVEAFRADDPALACARLTIDLFRTVRMSPLQVEARLSRRGARIAVLDVTIEQNGPSVGHGRAILLRRGDQPEGPFRSTPPWAGAGPVGDARATNQQVPFTAVWESWPVGAGHSTIREGLWIRDVHQLVEGEPLTPLIRSAMAADLVNPVSNSAPGGLSFINADYTIYLGREPRGEHIGIQPYGQISADGVAVGQCVAHDVHGPFGYVTTAAIANDMTHANSRRLPAATAEGEGAVGSAEPITGT